MDPYIVKSENLCKSYFQGKNEISALKDITFQVKKGEFISIVGKSGSGKSTLLNLLGGLDKSTSGMLIVDHSDLGKLHNKELTNHRRKTGFVFQSFNLIHSKTAFENVELPLLFKGIGKRKRKKIAENLLHKVGLEYRATHKPPELSGGEAQRVAIARALANNPEIILADEPTGNLDSETSGEIIHLLVSLNRESGITIIMVTHDKEVAGQISDKVIFLKDGKIVSGQS